MKHREISDYTDLTFRGFDISIYRQIDNTYILDIKHPDGELIAGWEYLDSFTHCKSLAREYINHNLVNRVLPKAWE